MVVLRRTVRANLGGGHPDELPTGPNGHAGQPAMRGLGTYYEFEVCCAGEPDPATGYLVNIKHIDQAVRTNVLPRVHHQLTSDTSREPSELLPELAVSLADALEVRLTALRWNLSPTFSLEYRMNDTKTVLMRQRFEFAAAHRLNVPAMSPDENREVFGKCNNPNGHGHNYRVEVTIGRDALDDAGRVAAIPKFESVVQSEVIDRLDHKHLNEDVPEFRNVNPSVENISRTIWSYLDGKLTPARLIRVRVWETAKTYAEYRGA